MVSQFINVYLQIGAFLYYLEYTWTSGMLNWKDKGSGLENSWP